MAVVDSLHIIFITTSGHTEYVIDVVIDYLKKKAPKLKVEKQRGELADAKDFARGDVLLLACATWNMWGMEGQLSPPMYELLNKRAKDVDLKGKNVAVISLGETKYYYTGRATEHLMQFVIKHGGKPFGIPFLLVDDPYGQEEKVQKWAADLLAKLKEL